ncbi:hypothetical protein [Pseudidiomarina mangrovi]|uniref:hypothetical protein n=1 Tax=Pseudidiomarina mangrovi TaxID=2487133 RepID=UPI000FCC4162|nr:hypothetical protein [Pseudidiomarina mangrovi]
MSIFVWCFDVQLWLKYINLRHHAPHTRADIVNSSWDRPYYRQIAAVRVNKAWLSVNRID